MHTYQCMWCHLHCTKMYSVRKFANSRLRNFRHTKISAITVACFNVSRTNSYLMYHWSSGVVQLSICVVCGCQDLMGSSPVVPGMTAVQSQDDITTLGKRKAFSTGDSMYTMIQPVPVSRPPLMSQPSNSSITSESPSPTVSMHSMSMHSMSPLPTLPLHAMSPVPPRSAALPVVMPRSQLSSSDSSRSDMSPMTPKSSRLSVASSPRTKPNGKAQTVTLEFVIHNHIVC